MQRDTPFNNMTMIGLSHGILGLLWPMVNAKTLIVLAQLGKLPFSFPKHVGSAGGLTICFYKTN